LHRGNATQLGLVVSVPVDPPSEVFVSVPSDDGIDPSGNTPQPEAAEIL
jgi:hypothetical protein